MAQIFFLNYLGRYCTVLKKKVEWFLFKASLIFDVNAWGNSLLSWMKQVVHSKV